MPQRSHGAASTSAPRPAPHSSSSMIQPAATAQTKCSVPRRPRLAASAVASVVLGPGVKVAAANSSSRAENSAVDMTAL
jgi:hypothetical protein